jgi:hypothetical protein
LSLTGDSQTRGCHETPGPLPAVRFPCDAPMLTFADSANTMRTVLAVTPSESRYTQTVGWVPSADRRKETM